MGDKGNADMLLAYEYSNLNITSQIKDKYWFVIDIYPGLCEHVRIFGKCQHIIISLVITENI